MNANELKAQMARHGDTAKGIVQAMKTSHCTFSCKLHGTRNQCFSQRDIQFFIDRYKLTADEVMLIFFTPQVSNFETNE